MSIIQRLVISLLWLLGSLAYAGNELIIDNQDSGFSIELGEWGTCNGNTCGGQPYGPDFRYAPPREDGSSTPYYRARFTPHLPTAGDYEVYVWWPQGIDRATDAPITVYHAGGQSRFTVDLRNQGSHWRQLGSFSFIAGASGIVMMEDATTGYANADAVRFVQTTTGDVSYSGNFPATTPKVNEWAGLTQATLTINGVPRDLLVYRPNASSQLPLLILLSPTGSDLWSNIADEFGRGNLTDFADREGVVLVLPMQRMMTRGDWDNHTAGTPYYETAVDDGTPDNQVNAPVSSDPNVNPDLLLVRAAIQEAQRAYQIDASRIYVNGFSNGAFFSYFVAATLNQQIAAFAETGGGLVLSKTTYGEPVPCPVISLVGNPGEARSCADSGWTTDSCVSLGAIPRPIAPSNVARVPPGFLEANDDDYVVPFAHTCNLAHHLSGEHVARIIHEGGGHIVNAGYLENSWNFLKTHRSLPDLMLAGLTTNGLIFYTPNLTTWVNIPGQLSQLQVGDLNGDGHADLVGVASNGSIWYTTNRGAWTQIPGGLAQLQVGDFNGDGKADLAGLASNGSIWYTTNLSTWTQVPGGLAQLRVGDFNGDGKADLAGLASNGSIWYTTNLTAWTNIPGQLAQLAGD
ncbi:MAG: FG-GAP-like repeat-containing protein [Candidatus Contendobacter sp.]